MSRALAAVSPASGDFASGKLAAAKLAAAKLVADNSALHAGPLMSLQRGQWVKLICGASYQHLPVIRDLALVYTLAGVDCIDMAADAAVVAAVRQGVAAAIALTDRVSHGLCHRPWLMVSLNDGEDPHFRKAVLGHEGCKADCHQPCVSVCPAMAIEPLAGVPQAGVSQAGVPLTVEILAERCYGCGRCLPICPTGTIGTVSRPVGVGAIATHLLPHIDAIEIHTQPGRQAEFSQLWRSLRPAATKLKLVAVSCPDGPNHLSYLRDLYDTLQPQPACLVWQTDGRPMSGDIGAGTTHATVKLAQRVLNARLPGYVQLAGGTNAHTIDKLRQQRLLGPTASSQSGMTDTVITETRTIAGVAYGSYARRLVASYLTETGTIEADEKRLQQAVTLAQTLVDPLKHPMKQSGEWVGQCCD